MTEVANIQRKCVTEANSMKSQSFFKSNHDLELSSADVEIVGGQIEELLSEEIKKSLFNDFLTGFKILTNTLQSDVNSSSVLMKWLLLVLRTQIVIDPNDVKLRRQFEQYVPAIISYVVAALQHRPQVSDYHYQLLDTSLQILDNIQESTLKKVANLDSGLIPCLWLPIDFVGDFNTQMVALRLLVKLLKYVEDSKQQSELEKICTFRKSKLMEDLSTAVRVASFQEGKFENTARNLLNNYNMNVARNVLVFSLRCKSVNFGGEKTFYKTLNSEHFWIDFNYCPRNLTFDAQYRENKNEPFIKLNVRLQISKLILDGETLTANLSGPAQMTKEVPNYEYLKTLRSVQFELLMEEALRLKENEIVLSYYNSENGGIQPETSASGSNNECLKSDHKETSHKESNSQLSQKDSTMNVAQVAANENFAKSYDFLIGNSGEHVQSNADNTNTPEVITALHSLGHSQIDTPSADDLGDISLSNTLNNSQKPEISASGNTPIDSPKGVHIEINNNIIPESNDPNIPDKCTNIIIDHESPKTSRLSSVMDNKSQKATHPITDLRRSNNRKRRFFSKSNEDESDSNGSDRNSKKAKTRTRQANTKNNARNHDKKSKVIAKSPTRKRINKVKPMNHLTKTDVDPENAIEDDLENGGILNITSFLRNGNESSAVFNDDQRRIKLENVNRISNNLEHTEEHVLHHESNENENRSRENIVNMDIYDNLNVSDAEPGVSYRNFIIRRPEKDAKALQSKPKREKKTTNVKRKANNKISKRNTKQKVSTRETNSDQSDIEFRPHQKICTNSLLENSKPRTRASIRSTKLSPNKTVFSANMEIDLTENDSESDFEGVTRNERESPVVNKIKTFYKRIFQRVPSRQTKPLSLFCDDGKQRAGVTSSFETMKSPLQLNEVQECRGSNLPRDQPEDREPLLSLSNTSKNFSVDLNLSNINREQSIGNELIDHNQTMEGSIHNSQISASHENNIAAQDEATYRTEDSNECILYRERSDYENSDESDIDVEAVITNLEQLKTPPGNIATIHQLKSTTKSVRKPIFSSEPYIKTCHVTTSVTTRQIISQDLVLVPTTPTRDTIPIDKNRDNDTMRWVSTLQDQTSCRDLDHVSPVNEVNELLHKFKLAMEDELKNIQIDKKETNLDFFTTKVSEISERLLKEAEKERTEMEQSEKEIEKIIRQLGWHWETFQKKTQQFNCFKKTIKQFLDALGTINFEEDIDNEFNQLLTTLQRSGNEIRSKQWKEFIKKTTDDFVNNITSFSNF